MRDLAASRGLQTVVVTFDRHPATVVRPKSAPRLLCDLEQKLELLAATAEMAERHPETPVITMSMGALGAVSRLCGEAFGSAMTFGAVGQVSAPGQIPVEELNAAMDILHRALAPRS